MPFDSDAKARLEKLLMTDVSGRFALMYRLGLEQRLIANLDLGGSPSLTASVLERKLESWDKQICASVTSKIMESPLPDGIPD